MRLLRAVYPALDAGLAMTALATFYGFINIECLMEKMEKQKLRLNARYWMFVFHWTLDVRCSTFIK